MIWHGGQSLEEGPCQEDTFRSLVELAYSMELGSHYKASLNALLCALCRADPSHFSLLLASCQDVLLVGGAGGGAEEEEGGEGARMAAVGQRLNTLARAAQSLPCTRMLLNSDLVSRMISRLANGFEKLLDLAYEGSTPHHHHQTTPPPEAALETPPDGVRGNLRSLVSSLSCLLAFLTDLLHHWLPAKEWMAGTDGHRFWWPMVQFLCMETAVVSPLETSFLQEVAFNFFCVCLTGCQATKGVFVRLICDLLRDQPSTGGAGGGGGKGPVLTPFLHRLLVGLVFRDDHVPIVLRLAPPPRRPLQSDRQTADTSLATPVLSLPRTCQVLDFHPSYPVQESCYYLQVPGSLSLAQLHALLLSHAPALKTTPTKPLEPKKLEKATAAVQKKIASSSAKSLTGKTASSKASTGSAESEVDGVDVAKFKLGEWRGFSQEPDKQVAATGGGEGRTGTYFLLNSDHTEEEEGGVYHYAFSSYVRQRDQEVVEGQEDEEEKMVRSGSDLLRDLVPLGTSHPLMVVMDQKALHFAAEHDATPPQDMFRMLVSCDGLTRLARGIPPSTPTSGQVPSPPPAPAPARVEMSGVQMARLRLLPSSCSSRTVSWGHLWWLHSALW